MGIIYTKPSVDDRYGKATTYTNLTDYYNKNVLTAIRCTTTVCTSCTITGWSSLSYVVSASSSNNKLICGSFLGQNLGTHCASNGSFITCLQVGFLKDNVGSWAIEANICITTTCWGTNVLSGNLASYNIGTDKSCTGVICIEKNAGGCSLIYWDACLLHCDATGATFNLTRASSNVTPSAAGIVMWPTSIQVVCGDVKFLKYNC